jgi:FMN phosphatase YigB (HAD superfamily)
VHAAVRRSLKSWDRRRWLGLTGKEPLADEAALRRHLANTLVEIAGHALPTEESDAVVRRMLHPAGEVEKFPDVAPALERLRAREIRVGVVTELPAEAASWLLRRTGLASELLVAPETEAPPLPDKAAFRTAVDRVGSVAARTAFVGDLYWSGVRAAARAGLPALLLDRHDAWPKVTHGRLTSLNELEAALARGAAPPGSAEPDEEIEPAGPA